MGNPWAPPEHPRPQGAPPQGPREDVPPPPHPAPAPGAAQPPAAPPAGHVPAGPPAPHPGAGGGPAQGGTPSRPTPPEPDRAGLVRSTRTSAWGAVALLVAVLLVSAPYPWAYATPVASLAALTLGVVAVVRGVRAHARGATVVLTAVLVVASALWTLMSVQVFVYASAREAHQECRARALTVQAERVCDARLVEDVERTTRSLLPTVPEGGTR
ncbi:hypothetical protein GC089_05125 [Cellulomonas sp. JZ18]|uniref:hypothetical protein n=1 Tax=Cellulomonas sp. JZ18 TaxID=2654191 RepID=UPI0012D3C6E1|nr:hypothetical protein [Cellulomonas sp. JZ18]QGQ18742.1 hypothetical protein GC089_05125 [Cellulomonas sp. JZ18]